MYKWEKKLREDKYREERKNPSFSSSLLDEIYRSTDDGAAKSPDLKFYRETMNTKQSKSSARTDKAIGNDQMSSLRRASLVEKWMEKKVNEKENVKQRQFLNDYERKLQIDHDHDHDLDALFSSSTSSSSDSSSGGFSSSDTDSLYGSRRSMSLKASSFVPARPKPVKTSVTTTQPKNVKKTERALFYEQRELNVFDDYQTEHTPKLVETDLIKSKSRALKIYNNLKQPISPGGRVANFINSLFTTGNAKKPKNPSSTNASFDNVNTVRSSKSGQVSTCSSASSLSRSCLSKNSPSTRESLRSGAKRSVRFYPVSVIVDEDSRPCGHKCLYEEQDASLMSVSAAASAWKIGKSPSSKNEEKRVGEMAREFLKNYYQNQLKNDQIMRDADDHNNEDDDDADDATSCSSSDLFELDHLNVIGNNVNRFCEELPVYETTHVDTNRAIANGLIM